MTHPNSDHIPGAAGAGDSDGAGPSGSSPLWDFSWAWGNQQFADIIIRFQPDSAHCSHSPAASAAGAAGEGESDLADGAPGLFCSFYSHQLVLSAGSVYFRTLLTSPEWSQAEAGTSTASPSEPPPAKRQRMGKKAECAQGAEAGGPGQGATGRSLRVHVEHVDPADLAVAVPAFMRFLYLGTFTQEVVGDPAALVQVMLLAERYDVAACRVAAARALGQVAVEQLDVSLMAAAMQLPGSLMQLEGCKQLQQRCCTKMLQLFGNTNKIITEPATRQLFCTLPFGLVKLWARFEHLAAESENTIVLLLTLWHRDWVAAGFSLSQKQLKQLSNLVRVRHLSPVFLSKVLPAIGWFQTKPDAIAALEVASQHPSLPMGVWRHLSRHVAAKWTGNPRAGIKGSAAVPVSWEWQLESSRIEEALQQFFQTQERCVVLGPQKYSPTGFCFEPRLIIHTPAEPATGTAQSASSEPGADIALFVRCFPGLPSCAGSTALQVPDASWGFFTKIELVLGNTDNTVNRSFSSLYSNLCDGYGFHCVMAGIRTIADLQRYMTHNKLAIKVTVTPQ